MKRETYWVTVATLIPVLAIASGLELRGQFDRIEKNAQEKDLGTQALSYFIQALITGALLLVLPVVLSDLYDKEDPGYFVQAVVDMGITFTAIIVALGPIAGGFRTLRTAKRMRRPRPEPRPRRTDEDRDDGDGDATTP
jgi:hypothetical protein